MKLKSLFLALATITLSSCDDKPDPSKDETTTVNGTVVEYGTNKPLAGATVKMVDREAGRDTVATTTSDNKGKFSYSYNGPISFSLCSYVFKEQYFTNLGTEGPGKDKFCHRWGVENNPVLKAKPYAWLKLRLINTSGASSVGTSSPPGDEGNGIQFSGSISDTTIYFRVWGNYQDNIAVFIYHGSNQDIKLTPFYAPGHDTAYYEIKY